MKVAIREASVADYDSLCALFDEGDVLHRAHLPHVFRKPAGPVREHSEILRLISDQSVGLFVAEVESQVVGLIHGCIKQTPELRLLVPRRYAEINNLIVAGHSRRAGIGRALMDKAHAWALAQGVDVVELNVWEFNREAIAFYQQLGYETSRRKMSKELR